MKALEAFEIAKNFNLVNEKLKDVHHRIKVCARWGGYHITVNVMSPTDRKVVELLKSDGFKVSDPGWTHQCLISWNLKEGEKE